MRAYQDMVFSTAARLVGDDRQAEDIAQEVFLKAYENFAHLSTSPSAGPTRGLVAAWMHWRKWRIIAG